MLILVIHIIVFAVASVAMVALWIMAGGSVDLLGTPLQAAREHGFWPLWVIVGWATVVALHAGVTVPVAWSLRRRRDRRADRTADDRRWIAVMFTDLTGSTSLAEELGDEAWADLIADYRDNVRETARRNAGTEVGTQGDGLLVRFPSPAEAVRCAADLQARFARERDRGASFPPLRVGVHAGEAVARDGDLLGQMVNIASRVADVAGPDEVLVTEPVADHAGPDVTFADRGLRELRGVTSPRHLLALRWDDDG